MHVVLPGRSRIYKSKKCSISVANCFALEAVIVNKFAKANLRSWRGNDIAVESIVLSQYKLPCCFRDGLYIFL